MFGVLVKWTVLKNFFEAFYAKMINWVKRYVFFCFFSKSEDFLERFSFAKMFRGKCLSQEDNFKNLKAFYTK